MGGAATIAYFLLFYIFKKELFLSPMIQWASLLIYGLFMYKACEAHVDQSSSDISFREAVRAPFLVFVLINLCYYLFYYALHLYDAELLKMETATQIAYLKGQIQSGLGDPQQTNKIKDQIQYLETNGMSLPLGPIFLQMGMGAMGGFLYAAGLTGLCLWRKQNN